MTTNQAVILEHVTMHHGANGHTVRAVSDITLSIREGEFVSLIGPSGSGKSTLLNLIAGLDVPNGGRVTIEGHDLSQLSENGRSDLRLRRLGFVFQSFNLFPSFTVEENVTWPLEFLGVPRHDAHARTAEVLHLVGIPVSARRRRPAELSGGEQQRVAIARALVTQPKLLLADEPTGNLDSTIGGAVLDLLRNLNRAHGLTIIMVTHSSIAATYSDRIVELCDGRVVRETDT